MTNDTGTETPVGSIEDASAPDSAVSEDVSGPAAADAGSSDSDASEDARNGAAADASSSDGRTANAAPESSPIPDAGAPDSAASKDTGSPASPAPDSGALDQITQIAAQSEIARYFWKDRGIAPKGYIKGMALAYARVYCKLGAGDATATEMATPKSADSAHDALAWYDPIFAAAGMDNDTAGADTLRHLFVLLIGLGMRESSGRYCEGRDRSASNTTAETAEAGLFQTSFNARTASPLLPTIFTEYSENPSGFVEVFKEGVKCSASDLENFGSGDGAEFQRLSKACPAFAAEFAALGLRHLRTHWGPINRRGAEVRPECDAMLRQVQDAVDANPELCSALQ
jgi:hypothetical protein